MLFAAKVSSHLKKCQQGLTLVELLIALAIMAILLTVVAPNIQSILTKNRITADINEMSSVVQYARFSAIDQSNTALVCPSDDFENCSSNWDLPKIVFIDNNANGSRDSSEALLMTTEATNSQQHFSGPNAALAFDESGISNMSVSLVLCPNDNDTEFARSVNVNQQGRTRISIDSNNDGIHEDVSGNNLSCS